MQSTKTILTSSSSANIEAGEEGRSQQEEHTSQDRSDDDCVARPSARSVTDSWLRRCAHRLCSRGRLFAMRRTRYSTDPHVLNDVGCCLGCVGDVDSDGMIALGQVVHLEEVLVALAFGRKGQGGRSRTGCGIVHSIHRRWRAIGLVTGRYDTEEGEARAYRPYGQETRTTEDTTWAHEPSTEISISAPGEVAWWIDPLPFPSNDDTVQVPM